MAGEFFLRSFVHSFVLLSLSLLKFRFLMFQFSVSVSLQDEYEDSWEAADDLSEDLLRGYEDKWWKAVKTGDYDTIVGMLIGGREALVSGVDDERRSALHYSCGTGNVKCAKLLLVNGAEVDLRDKDGYTPLHIASGYMHKPIVSELIEAGADPEIEDNNDRSPLQLVETLRDNLPPNNPTVFSRRLQLNEVIKLLEDNLYEEVTPRNILKARKKAQKKGGEEGGEKKKDAVEAGLFGDGDEEEEEEEMMSVSDLDKREFLVQWGEEDIEPSWVPLKHMADDVVEDFDQGLEYAEALRILEKREEVVEAVEANLDADTSSSSAATAASEEEGEGEGEGEGEKEGEKAVQTKVEYLIEWSDGYENSWEPEGHVSDDLVKLFEQQGEPARQVSSVTS